MAILSFKFTIDTDTFDISVTDIESNKTKTISLSSKSLKKVVDIEESKTPQITLYEGKYELNRAAMTVLDAKPGDRLVICFNKEGKPLIGKQIILGQGTGNKISNSNTVIFKGAGHAELAKFGNVFDLVLKETGIYYLIGNKMCDSAIIEDENLQIPSTGGMPEIPDIEIEELFKDFNVDLSEDNYTVSGLDFIF